ncbi:50S ribosomal protein L4, partial [Clostridium sp. ZBS14]|uniref:50S ribosomal protein L4 n=1 Tax=Clostridium sp. ZBS14 TaxID=2949970 RepID=UPI00207AB7D9
AIYPLSLQDVLQIYAPKTKDMVAVLKGLTVEKKALIVTADANESVELSARNIPGVTVITADGVNVLDVLHHDKLIMTKAAVEK